MPKFSTRFASALVATLFLFGLASGTAQAQSADECTLDDGIEAYLACLAGGGGSEEPGGGEGTGGGENDGGSVTVTSADTLPRTGSDVGSMVGIGSALVILGGAAVYGVRQRRSAES